MSLSTVRWTYHIVMDADAHDSSSLWQGKFRRFHESLFASAFSAPFTAANVSLALKTPGRSVAAVGSAPHEALERELSDITDTLVQQIERLL